MTPRRIMAFTGTRADFGLLKPVLRQLSDDDRFDVVLVVGGSHFSPTYGDTVDEITDAGFDIDWKIDVDVSTDSAGHIVRAAADTMTSTAEAIRQFEPDLALVLGDRYEALGFAAACLLTRLPLAHVHGGEVTAGALDDAMRNAITQMASLHLVAARPFADRVVAMGAPEQLVAVVGAPGLDTLREVIDELDDPRAAVEAVVGPLDSKGPIVLVSYHPETLSADDPGLVMRSILDTLLGVDDSTILVSAPNADWGRNAIAAEIERTEQRDPGRVRMVRSFGHRAYIAAMLTADVIVGNSSSGVIEAPFTGTPTVNVGLRQEGRPRGPSIHDSTTDPFDIKRALDAALAAGSRRPGTETVYGSGDTSARIRDRLLEYFEA